MCGFFTILDREGRHVLQHNELLDQINHRGPDARGLLFFDLASEAIQQITRAQPHLALGHTRLSILDLDPRSNQPFTSPDGRYVIVYNGEIYNYIEIRNKLQSEGISFCTKSDTEVALQALIHWGPELCLNKFDGMFAFSLFDSVKGTVLTGRDQFGIKPLFATQWSGGFAYASEVWPLLSLPGVSRNANPEKLVQYITSGGQEHDGNSYFKNIRQVLAGSYELIQVQGSTPPEITKYWNLKVPKDQTSVKDAVSLFRDSFLANVRLHLRSDVPFGVALSGGLDSSAIVGAIRYLEPDIKLKTFSFLPGSSNWSEERWIDICNDYVKADPYKVIPNHQDLIDDLPILLRAQGEPFGSTSIYAQFRVMKLASETGVKVILDGQGADELLGGYAPYISARILSMLQAGQFKRAAQLIKLAPNWVAESRNRVLLDLLKYATPIKILDKIKRFVASRVPFDWISPDLINSAKIYTPGGDVNNSSISYLKSILLEATTQYGLPELLRYEDRNSMCFSLESRVPFLTANFAEMCMSLPETCLIDDQGRTKSILREALNGIVPNEILSRKDKIGFRPDFSGINQVAISRFLDEAPNMSLPTGLDWSLIISRLEKINQHNLEQSWVWRVINLAYWNDLVIKHPNCWSGSNSR